jgi:hypothetical protein
LLPVSFACSLLPAISSIKEETKRKECAHTCLRSNRVTLNFPYIYNRLGKKNNSSTAVDSVHDRTAQQEMVYETNTRCQERR